MTKKHYNFGLFLLISFLALSLPLVTSLVQRSQDDRSKAAESDIKVNLKIAFKGLKPESTCSTSLKSVDLNIVNITKKVYQSAIGTSIVPVIGETNSDGDQVFSISNLSLNSDLKNIDAYNYFQIKNPIYLSARMCFNNQSDKVSSSSACDLPLTNGVTYDFTKYPLNPGDLNQDGIVNASDFSKIKYSIDSSSESQCGQQTDLNYDGLINSFDISYLKQSLLQTSDEETIINPTTTPTITSTVTPTLTATVSAERSLTAQKFETMKYWLYLPNGYTKDKKWPLVIWLHGGGEFGNNLDALFNSGLPKVLKQGRDYEAVIIAPQFVKKETKYITFLRKKLVPNIIENYNIDTDKISLVGHSTGANEVYDIACTDPKFFSAFVAISLCNHSWGCSRVIGNSKTKIRLYHGTSDSTCGSWRCVVAAREVKDFGGRSSCTQIKGAGHNITDQVFKNYKAVEWMIQQVRGQ